MNNNDFKITDSQSSSITINGINLLLDCPYKYYYHFIQQDGKQFEKKITHGESDVAKALLFNRDAFNQHYFVTERTAKYKHDKAWQMALAEAHGRKIVFNDDYERLSSLYDYFYQSEFHQQIFDAGQVNEQLLWFDEDTGLHCKAQPDYRKSRSLIDVHIVRNASAYYAACAVAKQRLYRKAAFYIDGCAAVYSHYPQDLSFTLLFIEKEPPFVTSLYLLSQEDIAQGRREYKKALQQFTHYQAYNRWPSYGDKLTTLYMPIWAYDEGRK